MRLASFRLGWVWWLRPTARGVWLASTNRDQVRTQHSGALSWLLFDCRLFDLLSCDVLYALIFRMPGTGLTNDADCALCGPGKYQTGVGLNAEANCTWCVSGKYQSGSGPNTAFLLSLHTKTPMFHRYIRAPGSGLVSEKQRDRRTRRRSGQMMLMYSCCFL